jgi:hypothetical protein
VKNKNKNKFLNFFQRGKKGVISYIFPLLGGIVYIFFDFRGAKLYRGKIVMYRVTMTDVVEPPGHSGMRRADTAQRVKITKKNKIK